MCEKTKMLLLFNSNAIKWSKRRKARYGAG